MTPWQRNAYRAALAVVAVLGLMGAAWLALGPAPPDGVRVMPAQERGAAPSVLPAPTATPIGGALVNINTASRPELTELPRIGEVLADRIVEYRLANGPFLRTDHLMAVRGIGPVIYEAIQDLITVEE